jgi:hypothetical protein
MTRDSSDAMFDAAFGTRLNTMGFVSVFDAVCPSSISLALVLSTE